MKHLVTDTFTSQYLHDMGYSRKTKTYWVLNREEQPLLVYAENLQTDDIAIPAPNPTELKKDLPALGITGKNKRYYVTYRIAAHQTLFQLKDSLADALGYMWIQLKELTNGL